MRGKSRSKCTPKVPGVLQDNGCIIVCTLQKQGVSGERTLNM